jgi:hypothetical protein
LLSFFSTQADHNPSNPRVHNRLTQLKGGLFNLLSYKLDVRDGQFILVVSDFFPLGSHGEPAFQPVDTRLSLTSVMACSYAAEWAVYAQGLLDARRDANAGPSARDAKEETRLEEMYIYALLPFLFVSHSLQITLELT